MQENCETHVVLDEDLGDQGSNLYSTMEAC